MSARAPPCRAAPEAGGVTAETPSAALAQVQAYNSFVAAANPKLDMPLAAIPPAGRARLYGPDVLRGLALPLEAPPPPRRRGPEVVQTAAGPHSPNESEASNAAAPQ